MNIMYCNINFSISQFWVKSLRQDLKTKIIDFEPKRSNTKRKC